MQEPRDAGIEDTGMQGHRSMGVLGLGGTRTRVQECWGTRTTDTGMGPGGLAPLQYFG